MNHIPALITFDQWTSNSSLVSARHMGWVDVNGIAYVVASDSSNHNTPDLIAIGWLPVYEKLGRSKTIGLIENGTSLTIAKQMINVNKKDLPKL